LKQRAWLIALCCDVIRAGPVIDRQPYMYEPTQAYIQVYKFGVCDELVSE